MAQSFNNFSKKAKGMMKKKYVKIKPEKPQKENKPSSNTKSKSKSNAKKAMSIIGTSLVVMFLIIIVTTAIVGTVVATYILQYSNENYGDVNLKQIDVELSTFVYARDEEDNLVELKKLSNNETRIWVDISEMPKHLLEALVATEDKRFYDHEGVDWYRIVGVALSRSGQGGSTITMQLVRDITNDKEISEERKLREIFRSLSLEEQYSKDDIIEAYLNRIWFGGGTIYGIGAAADYYFDKQVSELTIAESAMLTGLIRNPSKYSPYVDLGESKRRQLYSLSNMYDQGFISTEEFYDAQNEQLKFKYPVEGDAYGYFDERYYADDEDDTTKATEDIPYEAYKFTDYKVTTDWYMDAAIESVIRDLMDKRGVSYQTAREELYSGGYSIELNVDLDIQAKLNEFFANPSNVLSSYDKNAQPEDLLQTAFVVMDYMGNVKAVIGGLGEKQGNSVLNRATQSYRAIGSTIKPISVYAPAVNMNKLYYSELIEDAKIEVPVDPNDPDGEKMMWPSNYGNWGADGKKYTSWQAVQQSINTIAVRIMEYKVTPKVAYEYLSQRLGFSDLDPVNDIALSPMSLGALTKGAKLHELVAAYQIFGNGGIYYEPYLYSKVTDSKGNVVLSQNIVGISAIDPDSAWIVNRMMYHVVNGNYGTGRNAKLGNVEVIGKTGTANDMSTLLFMGQTPEYVAGIWIGYDDSEKEVKSGFKTLATVWKNAMSTFVDTSQKSKFTADTTVQVLQYCTETGLIASETCPHTATGYYKQGDIPPFCTKDH